MPSGRLFFLLYEVCLQVEFVSVHPYVAIFSLVLLFHILVHAFEVLKTAFLPNINLIQVRWSNISTPLYLTAFENHSVGFGDHL